MYYPFQNQNLPGYGGLRIISWFVLKLDYNAISYFQLYRLKDSKGFHVHATSFKEWDNALKNTFQNRKHGRKWNDWLYTFAFCVVSYNTLHFDTSTGSDMCWKRRKERNLEKFLDVEQWVLGKNQTCY